MPIRSGRDSLGYYYQWGNLKKYYYMPRNIRSRNIAYQSALRQAQAVYSSGYK